MAFKLIGFFSLVAVASAAILPNGQLIAEPEAPAHYNYKYQVSDPVTGDEKHQEESRDGDEVHGSYSLVEPDGTRRIVEYTADAVNGFQAVVHKEPAVAPLPHPTHVVAQPVHTAHPVQAVAPVHTVTPVHPIAHVSTSSLTAKVATLPAVRAYNPYHQYYNGLTQAYAGYAHSYSPYVNRYNNFYH